MDNLSTSEKEFIQQLDQDSTLFIQQFLSQGVCFRCIFMLFRITNLQIYRKSDYQQLAQHFRQDYNDSVLCVICQGVLQKCDQQELVKNMTSQIKSQGFEYEDFKMTFSISIIAYLNKVYIIHKAQDALNKRFKYNIDNSKNVLDFKEVFKWIVSPILSKSLNIPANLDGSFLLNFNFAKRDEEIDNELNEKYISIQLNDYLEQVGMSSNKKNKRNQKWSSKKYEKSNSQISLGAEQLLIKFQALPLSLIEDLPIYKNQISKINLTDLMTVECSHDNILLYGRYSKLSREVSQTPWPHEKSKFIFNVEQEISKNLLPIFGSSIAYLHAAGREDIDVRMLGRGRPFVMEFVNPKKAISCRNEVDKFQSIIQSDVVCCIDFKLVSKQFFDELKEVENDKAKAYCCVVWTQKRIKQKDCQKLDSMLNLQLKQKTPIRVLHRRSLMVRDKIIYKMKTEFINQHYFVLHLIASAGTYIKEFVHGDLGRTVPSVGQMLDCESDILQLDVTQVYDKIESVNLNDPDLFKVEVLDTIDINRSNQ